MFAHNHAAIYEAAGGGTLFPPVLGPLRYRAQVRADYTVGPVVFGNASFPPTQLSWNNVVIDENWGWTPSTAFVVPSGVRVVSMTAVLYTNINSASDGRILFYKNGIEQSRRTMGNQRYLRNPDRTIFEVKDGDQVEVYAALGTSSNIDPAQSFVSVIGYGP